MTLAKCVLPFLYRCVWGISIGVAKIWYFCSNEVPRWKDDAVRVIVLKLLNREIYIGLIWCNDSHPNHLPLLVIACLEVQA